METSIKFRIVFFTYTFCVNHVLITRNCQMFS